MKIGVVSDTHRMQNNIDRAIPYLKKCDLIIHAGDNFLDSKYIHKVTGIDVMAVKGNCDFENVEEELVFDVDNRKIFLSHGDNYGVKYGIGKIEQKAKEVNADIVIFGHTHIPFQQKKEGIIYINPGSLSLPRQVEYKSFVIINTEEETIEIKEVRL